MKIFSELGKAVLKLSRPGYDFEAVVTIVTKKLINVKADSPIEMAYDNGSIATNETEVTSSNTGIVSIFFGNTEITLIASGPNVEGIVSLTGANYTLNEDNSVTVQLPHLTKAMVIPVELTIKLSDDSTVKKTINIKRTAIEMSYIDKKVRGGYVMNKEYLYNNQPHNDEIFDAYLQVVLYRDDKVLGYRQVQIDDEEIY